MAVNNRAEAIIETNNQLVPTIDASELRAYLNDEVLNSVVFEKDVIASETPIAGAVTIDCSDKDLATVTTAVDLAVSFTNLENGAVKYLEVTKNANNVISFTGASDMVNFRDYINTVETVVVYRVSNKNGNIYVEALFAPASTKFQNITLNAGWTGTAKYRFNYFSGKVEIKLDLICGVGATANVATLPVAIQPATYIWDNIIAVGGLTGYSVKSTRIRAYVTDLIIDLTGITPGDLGAVMIGYFEYYKVLPV